MRPLENQKTIVVIGATGRLGSILRYEACKNGVADRFIWQARYIKQHADSERWIYWDPNVGANPAERLADSIGQENNGQPVTLLNLAGATPTSNILTPDVMERANLWLAKQVLKSAELLNAYRVLFASTAAVYGRTSKEQTPFSESAQPAPLNTYAQSKLLMEQWINSANTQIQTCILRIGNVAGSDALLGKIINNMGNDPLRLTIDQFETGKGPVRSYIGPESLFRIIFELVDCTPTLPDIINIAAQPPVSMDALLDAWVCARPADFSYGFQKAAEQAIETVALNTDVLQKIIGEMGTKITAQTIISETIRHYFERDE